MGLSGQEKNVFIVSFGTICTGRNSFSINREETSTEQEKNKYCISKVFLYQVLEDLYFAAPSVQILKTNLFLLICNDNVCLIVKDVFSELWRRKFSDFFFLELLCCSSGSIQKTFSKETYLNSKLRPWCLKEHEIGYCYTLSNFQCWIICLRKIWGFKSYFPFLIPLAKIQLLFSVTCT